MRKRDDFMVELLRRVRETFDKVPEDKVLGCGNFGITYKRGDKACKIVKDDPDLLREILIVKVFTDNMTEEGRIEGVVRYEGIEDLDRAHLSKIVDSGTQKSCRLSKRENRKGISPRSFCFERGAMSLRDLLKGGSRFNREDVVIQLLKAGAYLEKLDIIHMDIKPDNIIITKDFKVKLIDFGLSQHMDGRKVIKGGSGSPLYLPPEDENYIRLHQTDVWSIGVTILEILGLDLFPKSSEPCNNKALYIRYSSLPDECGVGKHRFGDDKISRAAKLCLEFDYKVRSSCNQILKEVWGIYVPKILKVETHVEMDNEELELLEESAMRIRNLSLSRLLVHTVDFIVRNYSDLKDLDSGFVDERSFMLDLVLSLLKIYGQVYGRKVQYRTSIPENDLIEKVLNSTHFIRHIDVKYDTPEDYILSLYE